MSSPWGIDPSITGFGVPVTGWGPTLARSLTEELRGVPSPGQILRPIVSNAFWGGILGGGISTVLGGFKGVGQNLARETWRGAIWGSAFALVPALRELAGIGLRLTSVGQVLANRMAVFSPTAARAQASWELRSITSGLQWGRILENFTKRINEFGLQFHRMWDSMRQRLFTSWEPLLNRLLNALERIASFGGVFVRSLSNLSEVLGKGLERSAWVVEKIGTLGGLAPKLGISTLVPTITGAIAGAAGWGTGRAALAGGAIGLAATYSGLASVFAGLSSVYAIRKGGGGWGRALGFGALAGLATASTSGVPFNYLDIFANPQLSTLLGLGLVLTASKVQARLGDLFAEKVAGGQLFARAKNWISNLFGVRAAASAGRAVEQVVAGVPPTGVSAEEAVAERAINTTTAVMLSAAALAAPKTGAPTTSIMGGVSILSPGPGVYKVPPVARVVEGVGVPPSGPGVYYKVPPTTQTVREVGVIPSWGRATIGTGVGVFPFLTPAEVVARGIPPTAQITSLERALPRTPSWILGVPTGPYMPGIPVAPGTIPYMKEESVVSGVGMYAAGLPVVQMMSAYRMRRSGVPVIPRAPTPIPTPVPTPGVGAALPEWYFERPPGILGYPLLGVTRLGYWMGRWEEEISTKLHLRELREKIKEGLGKTWRYISEHIGKLPVGIMGIEALMYMPFVNEFVSQFTKQRFTPLASLIGMGGYFGYRALQNLGIARGGIPSSLAAGYLMSSLADMLGGGQTTWPSIAIPAAILAAPYLGKLIKWKEVAGWIGTRGTWKATARGIGGVGAVVAGVISAAQDIMEGEPFLPSVGRAVVSGGTALGLGALGAKLGSFFGLIGTVVGGGIGALLGILGGGPISEWLFPRKRSVSIMHSIADALRVSENTKLPESMQRSWLEVAEDLGISRKEALRRRDIWEKGFALLQQAVATPEETVPEMRVEEQMKQAGKKEETAGKEIVQRVTRLWKKTHTLLRRRQILSMLDRYQLQNLEVTYMW